jgi:tryptophan synthase alpha chain
MMNRIDRLFENRKTGILSVFMTAGYPQLEDTVPLLQALETHGADMVEVGIPFSDPLADGPVIQQSSQVALENGMSLKLLFDQLKGIREKVHLPLLLMGYLNPIFKMGMETFLDRCREVGIDGVIIPDLPASEFEEKYRSMFAAHGIHHVMLVSPHTSDQRVRKIAGLSGGFLYMVSEASTTGTRGSVKSHQVAYFNRIRGMNLPVPGLIGFGISNRETFLTACSHASGAIIGSAFIKAIGGEGKLENNVKQFLEMILENQC